MQSRTILREALVVMVKEIEVVEVYINLKQRVFALVYALLLPGGEDVLGSVKLTFTEEEYDEAFKHFQAGGFFSDYFLNRLRGVCED